MVVLAGREALPPIMIRNSGRVSSYVSPSKGLNGFPRRSQLEANAETANADTYFNRSSGVSCSEATRSNLAYSIYSVIRCRKLEKNGMKE
uniref:Uncharacterized protein n=1 Tax=Anopheles minimus TaxID=112268 RepID=A0A182WIX5_9DIPT